MKRQAIKASKNARKQESFKKNNGQSKYAIKCRLFGEGKTMIKRRTIVIKETGKQINVPVDYKE